MKLIYKIAPESLWQAAEADGSFAGAPVDLADGFIHFSSAGQVRDTAAKHFAGQSGLVLAAIDADSLGGALRWEVSRGGDLFPHLYAPLDLRHVVWTEKLALGEDGRHVLPERIA